jgi:hypothetical protein
MLALAGINTDERWKCLDVGGADVNGSVRAQLPNAIWTGMDIEDGPGVDIVCDASTSDVWRHIENFDIVIATELFEHTLYWPAIIANMSACLSIMGPQILIATCASNGRQPHDARGGPRLPEGQYYGNVPPELLKLELERWFSFVHVEYKYPPGDAYMIGRGVKLPSYADSFIKLGAPA